MVIVPVAIPFPSSVVPWTTDSEGRRSAELPGIGRIVQLTEEEAEKLRAAADTNPEQYRVELHFGEGDAANGLYAREEA